ncbi:MAG TPA: hypothetical protein PLQ82_04305, partial [Desulfobacteraceae bacterium]|nr:hypothetical protein [Desulfobacteraceae bacterium]
IGINSGRNLDFSKFSPAQAGLRFLTPPQRDSEFYQPFNSLWLAGIFFLIATQSLLRNDGKWNFSTFKRPSSLVSSEKCAEYSNYMPWIIRTVYARIK